MSDALKYPIGKVNFVEYSEKIKNDFILINGDTLVDFDLNIFLEGVYGNKIFFQTMYTNLNSFQRGQNQMADLYGNYWTKEDPNPNSKYLKISSGTQMQASDRFIKDGSLYLDR